MCKCVVTELRRASSNQSGFIITLSLIGNYGIHVLR
jgi:hypothetical protein